MFTNKGEKIHRGAFSCDIVMAKSKCKQVKATSSQVLYFNCMVENGQIIALSGRAAHKRLNKVPDCHFNILPTTSTELGII